MLNKKNFPTLMLVLLSLAAILFAFAFFWNSFGAPYYRFEARYGMPPPNQSAPNFLQLGVFSLLSGLALDALLWLGAGLDRWLARLQKPLVAVVAYLVLPGVLCILLPAACILAVYWIFPGPSTGEQHFAAGFLTVVAFLPVVFGFISIYLGAGVSALSRWLAARIWREN